MQADRQAHLETLSPPLGGEEALVRLMRNVLFVGVWCLVWIGLEPFSSLSNNDLLGLTSGNDFWTYVAFGVAAALVVAATIWRRDLFLAALADPVAIVLSAYIGLNVLVSADFSASLRRFVLFGIVLVIANLVCLLPRDRDGFARLITGTALFVALLSYAGVMLVPELAVHQATDLIEARLAGDWRGVFGHKNLAGGVFSTMVFIGIFAARCGLPVPGIALVVLAGLFVLFSGAKSSIIILVLTLAVTGASSGLRSAFWRGFVLFAPLAGLLALSVGSVMSPAIGGFLASLPIDTSFTGRADIWAFALEKAAERPWLGHGFQSFWTLESTKYGIEDNEEWAGSAANGHNGFLDAVLNLGLIGLAFTFAWLVARPFLDDLRARRRGSDPALAMLWRQLWLFGLYLGCMESFFFSRTDPIWFTLLVAVAGMRMSARFSVAARNAA